jgi:hypothetical protein
MKRLILFSFFLCTALYAYTQNVGIGNTSPASKMDVSGDLALREGTAISVASGANTITLPTAKNSVYRLTGAPAAFSISSISGGNDGMLLTLINATGQVMTVSNGSIQTNTGADLVASGTVSTVNLLYNATLGKWLVTAGEGFGTSSGTNIYNSDGTLTGSRMVTQGADNLTFSSTSGNFNFTTTGAGNVVMGKGLSASGSNGFATGITNTVSGSGALVTGENNTASGTYSIVSGLANQDYGTDNVVGGANNVVAPGYGHSVVVGNTDSVYGSAGAVFGYLSKITAFEGFAQGDRNTASGQGAAVFGASNTSAGSNAFATGYSNTANGSQGSVFGTGNTSESWSEAVFGTFATTYTPASTTGYNTADRIFDIGNGTSTSSTSDALTILKNGNVGIGNNAPTRTLQVNGTTSTTNLQMTNGAATGYLLQSDASGNATWVSATTAANAWGLTGNAGTTTGTNFIGTTDNKDLEIKVNNQMSGIIENNNSNQSTGFGYQTLSTETANDGIQSAAFGYQSLAANTTGLYNSGFGWASLDKNTTGENNTAVGNQALFANITGSNNTSVGSASLGSSTGSYNTALGTFTNDFNTTGSNNTAIGYTALNNNITGSYNTALGENAQVGPSNLTNATAIGANAEAGASNTVILGSVNGTNSATASVNVGIGTTTPTSTLQVIGKTSTTNFQMTTSPTSGYILQSDASWVSPSSITTTNTLTNATNTITSTVNGVVATAVAINTNVLSLSGSTLTSTINGVPSTGLNIASAANNIYNTDGTLTGNRTVTMGTDNLTFTTSTGNMIFNTSSTGSIVVGTGDATSTPVGGILRGPNAGAGTTTAGGNLNLNAGYGYNGGAGGSVFVNGGTTSGSGTNGNVYIRGGYTSPNEGAVYLNDDHSGGTFINAAGGLVTIGKTSVGTAQLTINNGISIDAAAANTGTISSSNSTTTGNAITFGGSGAGEGIGSNRANTTAGQNQYGVDLYTSFARRLSVTNTGYVGIGTTNPQVLTEISGGYTELLKLTSTTGGANNHAYIDFATYSGTYVDARIGAIDMGSNNGSLVFETGNVGSASTVTTERMRILNTGYVGINNTVPSNTLNVGSTTSMGSGIDIGIPNDAYGSNGSSYAIRFYGYRDVTSYVITAKIAAQRTYQCCSGSGSTPWLEQGTDLVFSTTNAPGTAGSSGAPADNTTERMRIKDNGNVGIGTSSPGYPLDIGTTVTGSLSGSYGYLAQSGSGTGGSGTGNQAISVHAAGRMFALEYDAQSDRRIKTGLSHPGPSEMLEKLNKLTVTDYSYIDKLQKGDKPKRGFIAQEVEEVMPNAVHQNTDIIPSVFAAAQKVSVEYSRLLVTTPAPHGFVKGDEILLYDKANKQYHVQVAAVIDDKTFAVDDWKDNTDAIFVYGKRVNDFRSVDFDQVTALAVGAIQELAKHVSALEQENKDLRAMNQKLQKQNTTIQSDVDKLKASVETLQQIVGAKAQK